jgi:23S rRNA pseudouridine1911/1915/1917 synthase
MTDAVRTIEVPPEAAGKRLDAYLATVMEEVSRSRIQLLIEQGGVRVQGMEAKASFKLRGGEVIEVTGDPRPEPLHAFAEDIPLSIVYEDKDLAVINKPAGMMVHAGAGSNEDARNRGTLVNALLHHFKKLSQTSGPLRPGIVHRLDKETSGLIVVAKNDATHAKLGDMFSRHQMRKTYIALVQGSVKLDKGTINSPISRDPLRRTRMTARRTGEGARAAVSHYTVLDRIETPYGILSLVKVRIETGRTHQIRVHMSSIGHPVVGDTLYGAITEMVVPVVRGKKPTSDAPPIRLHRNFLHAAELAFDHPRIRLALDLRAPLPAELLEFADKLGGPGTAARINAALAPPAVEAPKVARKAVKKAAKKASKGLTSVAAKPVRAKAGAAKKKMK